MGDSRAIIIKDEGGQLVPKPLSTDQTPYRRDERARVRKCGARVLNMDQLEVRSCEKRRIDINGRGISSSCCDMAHSFLRILIPCVRARRFLFCSSRFRRYFLSAPSLLDLRCFAPLSSFCSNIRASGLGSDSRRLGHEPRRRSGRRRRPPSYLVPRRRVPRYYIHTHARSGGLALLLPPAALLGYQLYLKL